MKTATLYAVALANETPGTRGYRVTPFDPDPGIPVSRRTFASGFAVPLPCIVPDDFTVAESGGGETLAWIGETPLALQWHPNRGTVSAWPAMTRPPESFTDRWMFKSVTRDALAV